MGKRPPSPHFVRPHHSSVPLRVAQIDVSIPVCESISSPNRPSAPAQARARFPSRSIRPACGLPGDYEFPTDSAALLELLRQQTDLPAHIIQRFEKSLRTQLGARLLGVELSDTVLTNIGYFID